MIKKYFLYILAFRYLNIVFNQTWFVPDEFWQSQEVAHRITFNYGYLTWEWRVGIRSYLYPLTIAFFYKLLEISYLDNTVIFLYIVPLLHATASALADLVFFQLTSRLYGPKIGENALFCRLISWFTVYMSSRSTTNTLEEIFTIFCLGSLKKTSSFSTNYWVLHIFGFISFVTRATSAINLIPIYIYQFLILCNSSYLKLKFFLQFALVGITILSLNIIIDSYFHGELLVTPYNFLLYNVFHNIAIHYGTHPVHWYLTQGYPTILATHLPLILIGLKNSFKVIRFPVFAIFFNLCVYSMLAHKEFRFLNQIMPFSMIISAFGLQYFEENFSQHTNRILKFLLVFINLALVIILGMVHQRAPISIMKHLYRSDNIDPNGSILFLTPCHSTPYYSFLHRNISMKFLTCEPNLDKSTKLYIDEADRFDINPEEWFSVNKNEIKDFKYLVMFENLLNKLENIQLKNKNSEVGVFMSRYKLVDKFYNSFVETSARTGKHMFLFSQSDPKDAQLEQKQPREDL